MISQKINGNGDELLIKFGCNDWTENVNFYGYYAGKRFANK